MNCLISQSRAAPLPQQGLQLKYLIFICTCAKGFPGGSDGKASACNVGDWVRPLGEESLEKEMATHSSTLSWKIPRTEEPGRLQSMGSQRVGHD